MIFVPNTVIQCEYNQHYLPRPDFDFLKTLANNGEKITVVGFVTDKTDPFLDSSLDDIENLSLLNIGRHLQYSGYFKKLKFYLYAIYRSIRFLSRTHDFVYLYYPSHLAKILGFYYMLSGKPYGLYVRGVWKMSGVSAMVSNKLFKHALYVFTTGPEFKKLISRVNPQTDLVYPMTTFTPDTITVPTTACTTVRNLLFVGHIRKRKGVIDTIRAVHIAKSRGIELILHIIGGGDEVDIDVINSEINDLELEDHVTYHGHISDTQKLKSYYEQADVFVYPSYYPEGFPRVIFEAMIFGLPIICTILPGMKGFMEAGVNCLEVDRESPRMIADALQRLHADPGLMTRLGLTSRNNVTKYFSNFIVKGHAKQFCEKARELDINGK